MDLIDNELTLTPINGKSGKAYMGSYPDGERVFVKMNTTPILAGLAKEQIAPQLLWSRRLPDGNVLTAQEWLSGDVRHSNWVETRSGLIYLVEWDSVRLTDRMFDVAHLLSHYIPEAHWEEWLTYYGYKYNEKVLEKLYWYSQYTYLCQIARYYENNDLENVNREIYALRNFRSRYRKES